MHITGFAELLSPIIFLFIGAWPLWAIIVIVVVLVIYNRRRKVPAPRAGSALLSPEEAYKARLLTALRAARATLPQRQSRGFDKALEIVEHFEEQADTATTADRTAASPRAAASAAITPAADDGRLDSRQTASPGRPDTVASSNAGDTGLHMSEPLASPEAAKAQQTLWLLYIGGFLLVAAVALFVLLAEVAGGVKIILVALLTAALYGGGLWLHRLSRQLRPAAVTFAAIGIGSVPFLGLALHQYAAMPGDAAWWGASLLGMAMAGYAVYALRSQLADYLLSFAWLSFAVASLALAGAAIATMLWGAIIAAIVMRYILRYWRGVTDHQTPYVISAHAAVPLAVLVVFQVNIFDMVLWKLAVTLGLAAMFYVQQAVFQTEPGRSVNASLGHLIGLAAVILLVYDVSGERLLVTGAAVAAVAAGQLAVVYSRWFTALAGSGYQWVLYTLTALLPLLVTLFWHDFRYFVIGGLVLSLAAGAALLARRHALVAFVPVIIAALFLPGIIGAYGIANMPPLIVVALYAAAACALLAARYAANDTVFVNSWRFGYGAALAVGFVWVLSLGAAWEVAVAGFVLAAVSAGLSYFERAPYLLALTPLFAVLALQQWLFAGTTLAPEATVSIAAAIVAAISYTASYALTTDAPRRMSLSVVAIGLGILAWPFAADSQVLPVLFGEIALLVSAAAGYIESRRTGAGMTARLISIAGMMLALQLGLYELAPDTHALVYTHLWAAYAALAWYLLHRTAGTANSGAVFMRYAALVVFSLPTALWALGEGGAYSLLLLVEHAGFIVLAGAFKNSLLVKWGAAVAVLSILYMLRDFTYVNVGIIAALLIGYALYRLGRPEAKQ